MPFGFGSGGAHDDNLHQGSAKKAIASGVASLDATAKVPDAQIAQAEFLANKGIANGYAGLDAALKFAGLLAGDTAARIVSNTYAGNDSANRAIAHGLPHIPKFVVLFNTAAGRIANIIGTYMRSEESTNSAAYAVTAIDATNFYVGNAGSYSLSMNNTGANYIWIAI